MILYLNKNFNEDLLNEVIDFYNKKPTDVQIYLNSNGGFKPYQVAIQHIIEQSNIPTSLYAFDYIASSAVDFFFTLSTKDKKILEGCNAMIHQSTIQVFLNEKMKIAYKSDSWVRASMKRHRKETQELCLKLGLTKKEINIVLKGDDLGISYERLLELQVNYEQAKTN